MRGDNRAMSGNSSIVVSAQREPHPRLLEIVARHRAQPWRAPPHAPTQQQFARWIALREATPRPLLVDLGCGTGDSSERLAALYPAHDVLGVDQSAARLAARAPDGFARIGRVALVRAEAANVLRSLAEAGIGIDLLCLLYPNPWPKPEHLRRRWHGHPVFPLLLANARRIVLRSNWRVYVDEFARASRHLGRSGEVRPLAADTTPISPFERKYLASGHACVEWRDDPA